MSNIRLVPIKVFPQGAPDLRCICGKEAEHRLDAKGWPIFDGLEIIIEEKQHLEQGKIIWWCGSPECYTMMTLQNI